MGLYADRNSWVWLDIHANPSYQSRNRPSDDDENDGEGKKQTKD